MEGPTPEERFELGPGLGAVEIEPGGLRHPRSMLLGRLAGRSFTPWWQITDLAIGGLGLRVATRRGIFLLRRNRFRDPAAPEALARVILGRIEATPGGETQLARIRALGERARAARRPWLVRVAAGLCVAAFGFQLLFSPHAELAGVFSTSLVGAGELWRLVTANVLHGGPFHLAVNVGCLLLIGGLAERCLGASTTGVVMGLAAAGAMLGSWLADYEWALGASGVVAGLVGALVGLELRHPEQVPAVWRLPRRIFVGVLVLESVSMGSIPGIAHAAHAGGFAAGLAAAAWLGAPGARDDGAAPAAGGRLARLRLANVALVAVGVLGVARGALLAVSPDPAVIERRASVLLELEDISPWILNNEAWLIATSERPGLRQLDAALALAERAVADTGREDPNVLDTLAEVHFAAGRSEQAVATIDEAIALAPAEPYFREQRRRYTGEREAGDRPAPPSPFGAPPPGSPSLEPEPPGIPI